MKDARTNILTTPDKHKISYYHYDAGHKQVIIIAPGFYNSKDAVLLQKLKDDLIDAYDVIMFDFRGHGKSSGLFSWTAKEESELKEIMNYAKTRYKDIGLLCFSMGAATAINLLAKNHAANSLVAVSAPSDVNKIEYKFWRLDFKNDLLYTFGKEGRKGRGVRFGPFWLKKTKPIESIEKVTCPIFYIHGEKDWVIGYKHSQQLYRKTKARRQIKIVKNGSHAEYLLRDNPEIIQWIRAWFRETLLRPHHKEEKDNDQGQS